MFECVQTMHSSTWMSSSFAASHNFWTSGWNCSRLTWELIWQTSLSSGSVWKLNLMKAHTAKTCRLTSAPDFSYNQLCSHVKAKPHSSRLLSWIFLTWDTGLYDLLCVAWAPWPVGLGNLSKNVVCNFKTISVESGSQWANVDFFSSSWELFCRCVFTHITEININPPYPYLTFILWDTDQPF